MRLAKRKSRFVSAVVGLLAVALVAGPALGQSYIYPNRGQSPQQQQRDQAECHAWAIQQPGANVAAVPPPPSGYTGDVVRGAAGGAAIGVVGGAIGGDAGKGAAIGAAAGALLGGMRRASKQNAAAQAQAQTSQAYGRAFAACLEGRGYTVK